MIKFLGASGSRATVPHVSPQGPHSASPSPRGQVLQAALPMPVFEGAMVCLFINIYNKVHFQM